jgi:hypothetical protein
MPNMFKMRAGRRSAEVLGLSLLALQFGSIAPGRAKAMNASYRARAPLDQYRIASQADEIALARSAAPPSISGQAEILTLGSRGYEIAAKGKNGFVCLVLRAWADGFDDPGFWNPTVRAPICYNPAAARTVLPTNLKRAQWALAGVSRTEMADRTKTAIAAHEIAAPEVGAMSYMLSNKGYLNDQDGHWHPHLMFFLPRMAPAQWGANTRGGAVFGDAGSLEPLTVFFVPVTRWSDGTAAGPLAK